MATFICYKCRLPKSLDQFYVRKSGKRIGRRTTSCKLCTYEKTKKRRHLFRQLHPLPIKKAIPERDRYLRRTYGLVPGGYSKLLNKQKGVCAICKKPPSKKRFNVDHDHAIKKIRGLLCCPCNTALRILENKVLLRRALNYLKKRSKIQCL
jgi:hypothetical protein